MKSRLAFLRTNVFEASLTAEQRLESFEQLYERSHAQVRRTLYWLVGSAFADDLVQEVFVKVWKSLDSFRKEGTGKAWIYRIAIHTAYDHLRKHKQRFAELGEGLADEKQNLESDFVAQDLIRRGIAELPEHHRSVFILFYKLELSLEEISETLRIPVGTVKSRLSGARETFGQFLNRNGVKL